MQKILKQINLPIFLFIIYILESIILGWNPYARDVWYAENIPIFILVATLVVLYIKNVRFSNLTYLLIFILPFLHTIGGHYTFEKVPFEWFSNLIGSDRNMFDRVAHLSVGFYALPLIEYLISRKLVTKKIVAYLFGIFAMATLAMTYELIEWIYAATWGGEAGAAFLGSQGDIWDAQKDMLMDTLGAISAVFIYIFVNRDK